MMKKNYCSKKNCLFLVLLSLIFVAVACGDGDNITAVSIKPPTSIDALSLKGVTPNSVAVSWNAVYSKEGIPDINMIYQVSALSDGVIVANNNVIPTSLNIKYSNNIKGLLPEKNYQITVKAITRGGETKGEGLISVRTSSKWLSVSTPENMLAVIEGVSNISDNKMEVTWEEKSNAIAYVLVSAEDQADLFGTMTKKTVKDKRVEVVCTLDIPDLRCSKVIESGKRSFKKILTGVKPDSRYTTLVLSLNFSDLIGLKVTDENGNKIAFADAVKELLEDSTSTLGRYVQEVIAAIAEDKPSVKRKVKTHWVNTKQFGRVKNLSIINYSKRVHVRWDHAIGATRYEVVLSNSLITITNAVSRSDASQFSGGVTVFTGVDAGRYTVLVTPYSQHQKGRVVKQNIEVKGDESEFILPSSITNLIVTNNAPRQMTLSWPLEKSPFFSRYDIYYYTGKIAPNWPNYTLDDVNSITIKDVKPGNYTIRIDAVAEGVIVRGTNVEKSIYDTPNVPRLINPQPNLITNIGNRLYNNGYVYTVVTDSGAEPGSDSDKLTITYTYRVNGGKWKDDIDASSTGKVVVQPDQFDHISSYGETYEIKATVKNLGGFSRSTSQVFKFRNFLDPIEGNRIKVISGDRQLRVSWPVLEKADNSTVFRYRVVVSDGLGNITKAQVYTNLIMSEEEGRGTVINGLLNEKIYAVNVFPESAEGWSLLTALEKKYDYPNDTSKYDVIDKIFNNYIGEQAIAKTWGKPDPVRNLKVVIAEKNKSVGRVHVSWRAAEGSPVNEYMVEYLEGVSPVLVVGKNSGEEVKSLDWGKAVSLPVSLNETNGDGFYVKSISGLNTSTVSNIFRVKGVNNKGGSIYEYYVLGTDATTPPTSVRNIRLSSYHTNEFMVAWDPPINGGTDKDGKNMSITSYRLSWKKRGEIDYTSSVRLLQTDFRITGLEPKTEYDVLIQAKNDANGSEHYNDGKMLKTWTPSVPGKVSSIITSDWQFDRYGSNLSFVINWDAADLGKRDNGSGDDYTEADLSYTVTVYTSSIWDKYSSGVLPDKTYHVKGKSKVISEIDARKRFFIVMITASNDVGLGSVAIGKQTWTPSVPDAVSKFSASDYTTNGFVLSWTTPDDPGKKNDGSGSNQTIIRYRVGYKEIGSGINNFITSYVTNGTSKILTNLSSGTPYEIQVIAINNLGEGKINKAIRVWTGSLPREVGTIKTVPGVTNILVSWLDTPGKAGSIDDGNGTGADAKNSYLVQYKKDEVGEEYKTFIVTNSVNVNITGLEVSKTYRIRVTASNKYGNSASKESAPVTTVSLAEPPGNPLGLALKEIITNGLVLQWTPPAITGKTSKGSKAILTGYVLQLYSNAVRDWVTLNDTEDGIRLIKKIGSETTATLGGLTGGKRYIFRVSALNGEKQGEYSDPVVIDTDWLMNISIEPTSIYLTINDSSVVSVDFSPTSATNTQFTWFSSDSKVARVSKNSDGTVKVIALSVGTATITAKAGGNQSVSTTVIVLPNSPQRLRQSSTCSKNFEVTLQWNIVSPEITKYEIYQIENGVRRFVASTAANEYIDRGLEPHTYYAYEIKACVDGNCSPYSSSLLAVTGGSSSGSSLADIVASGRVPADLDNYDEPSRVIFGTYKPNTKITTRYVLPESTAGAYDWSSWETASSDLKTIYDSKIVDQSTLYLFLLGPGVYKSGSTISIKNNRAVVGGVSQCNTFPSNADDKWSTVLSGEGKYQVLSANNINKTSVLYGITIANGKSGGTGGGFYAHTSSPVFNKVVFSNNIAANDGGAFYMDDSNPILNKVLFLKNMANNNGGAIYTTYSSPVLNEVVFSKNEANNGGAMYNYTMNYKTVIERSTRKHQIIYFETHNSPILNNVVFSENKAYENGGGMNNNRSSTPDLTRVLFSKNTAKNGGGMYNFISSPVLSQVIFSRNMASDYGGGIYNDNSKTKLIGTVFSGNTAKFGGGGIYQMATSVLEGNPTILNTILWGNGVENTVAYAYNSIVLGAEQSIVNSEKNIIISDPLLGSLTDNGGGISTIAIPAHSPAVDQGLYVRRSKERVQENIFHQLDYIFYYSSDKITWYNSPDFKIKNIVTLPNDTVSITEHDMTKYRVSGRPDIGVYEAR